MTDVEGGSTSPRSSSPRPVPWPSRRPTTSGRGRTGRRPRRRSSGSPGGCSRRRSRRRRLGGADTHDVRRDRDHAARHPGPARRARHRRSAHARRGVGDPRPGRDQRRTRSSTSRAASRRSGSAPAPLPTGARCSTTCSSTWRPSCSTAPTPRASWPTPTAASSRPAPTSASTPGPRPVSRRRWPPGPGCWASWSTRRSCTTRVRPTSRSSATRCRSAPRRCGPSATTAFARARRPA